jgi:hypothetical protein
MEGRNNYKGFFCSSRKDSTTTSIPSNKVVQKIFY